MDRSGVGLWVLCIDGGRGASEALEALQWRLGVAIWLFRDTPLAMLSR